MQLPPLAKYPLFILILLALAFFSSYYARWINNASSTFNIINIMGSSYFVTDYSTLSENHYTHCRLFPMDGNGIPRVILQWKIVGNQSFHDYTSSSNVTTDRYEISNNPVIRMKIVFGQSQPEYANFPKVFGFTTNITSDKNFDSLRKLLKFTKDKDGDSYQYFFDQDLNVDAGLRIIDLMDQPQSTFHFTNNQYQPTYHIGKNTTGTSILRSFQGTSDVFTYSNTSNTSKNKPLCKDDVNVSILPITKMTHVIEESKPAYKFEHRVFCEYHHTESVANSGGTTSIFEKRLKNIVRPKNLQNTTVFSEDRIAKTDSRYFVHFLTHDSINFKGSTKEKEVFLSTKIPRKKDGLYYLVHEVDFSKPYYDENCDSYVKYYTTSVLDLYYTYRAIRHISTFVLSIVVLVLLVLLRKKEPVKSRFPTSVTSASFCILFHISASVIDFFPTVFRFEGLEFLYYVFLPVFYLLYLVRYVIIRSMLRHTAAWNNREFSMLGSFLENKKSSYWMIFSSNRLFVITSCCTLFVIIIFSAFFSYALTIWPDTITAVINYCKLGALVLGFILPSTVVLLLDVFKVNDTIELEDGNKNDEETKKYEYFDGFFSEYNDPLYYRAEFLLVVTTILVIGISTLIVGVIPIPDWKTPTKTTIIHVHGILYFIFEILFVGLTCGFSVIAMILLQSKRRIHGSEKTELGKDVLDVLLSDKLEGRPLIYNVS